MTWWRARILSPGCTFKLPRGVENADVQMPSQMKLIQVSEDGLHASVFFKASHIESPGSRWKHIGSGAEEIWVWLPAPPHASSEDLNSYLTFWNLVFATCRVEIITPTSWWLFKAFGTLRKSLVNDVCAASHLMTPILKRSNSQWDKRQVPLNSHEIQHVMSTSLPRHPPENSKGVVSGKSSLHPIWALIKDLVVSL